MKMKLSHIIKIENITHVLSMMAIVGIALWVLLSSSQEILMPILLMIIISVIQTLIFHVSAKISKDMVIIQINKQYNKI